QLLGEAVRRISLLRVPVPKVLLVEWHGCELRVSAHGADGDELLDAALTPNFHQLGAHHQIVVKELPRPLTVRTVAAVHCCEVNNDVRTHVAIHLPDRFTETKVVGSTRWD